MMGSEGGLARTNKREKQALLLCRCLLSGSHPVSSWHRSLGFVSIPGHYPDPPWGHPLPQGWRVAFHSGKMSQERRQ